MKINAGTTLIVEHGEYSDFRYEGPFTVLKSFDQARISKYFKTWWKKQETREEWEEPSALDFCGWLVAAHYIEAADCHVWFVGSYSFDPDIQSPTPQASDE